MAGQYLFGAQTQAPAPVNPYASQFGIAPVGAGSTSYTRGGGAGGHPLTTGTAAAYSNPQTLSEYYALDPNQRRAYGDPLPLMQAGWQTLKDQGLGPGAATTQGFGQAMTPEERYNPANFGAVAPGATPPTVQPQGAGGYPPINPGEDSAAYMARIGMSQSQIQAALAMAQQNPGMSFQDIMARLGGGGGAGVGAQGSTGNIGSGVSLGNLTSSQGTVNGVPGYTGGGSFNLADWQDPGYAFRLKEGSDLLQGSAAAQGNLLSGPTLKALTRYGQDAASQEYQNAYNRFTGNRAFNYGVDTGDRAFDYLTQTGDRDFNYGVIKDLADQGRYGTTGESETNRLLATLLSANTISGGNANAAATMGTGNLTMDAITQYLRQQQQQGTLDRVFPQKTG